MKKSLGFWRSWALVVGTVIGSGVFTLPAILAPYGSFSFLGWVATGIGALSIAFSLCHLAARAPKVGGPYAYVFEAFGHIPAVVVAWGYWISLWIGVAAIAISFSGYMGVFIPSVASQPGLSAAVAITVVWIFTYINIRGVEEASIVQLITTVLKMIPLFVIGAIGLGMGDITSVPALNPNGEPMIIMISSMCLLIMWSYIGIEAATIPSDDVENPKKTIPRALIAGTLTATFIYMLAMAGVMAMIPPIDLMTSTSPFADAAMMIFGDVGALIIGVGALIAIGGALNSMILLSGVVPMAGAKDKMFPKIFAKQNKSGTPVSALIYSSILASIVILVNSNKGLLKAFEFMILLSTFTVLIAYLGSAFASIKLQITDIKKGVSLKPALFFVSTLAAIFSVIAIIGAYVLYQ
ncbi:APC family permease [Pseudemcibacter aquimaris]|uniref:APC family permease n=1 Tax=Pseudemcibacter aquimaris TaxID=2857064 RepID=UPI0020114541|nr:amino acid permease [Pseudemcibacter aquimaris]MCC3862027.1 amino acid permease [Pseudemcibacter aquimaris]WDU58779.1 amino acid permease [Pseudemcibacter aquimaris]